jgi:hypothetical protein
MMRIVEGADSCVFGKEMRSAHSIVELYLYSKPTNEILVASIKQKRTLFAEKKRE